MGLVSSWCMMLRDRSTTDDGDSTPSWRAWPPPPRFPRDSGGPVLWIPIASIRWLAPCPPRDSRRRALLATLWWCLRSARRVHRAAGGRQRTARRSTTRRSARSAWPAPGGITAQRHPDLRRQAVRRERLRGDVWQLRCGVRFVKPISASRPSSLTATRATRPNRASATRVNAVPCVVVGPARVVKSTCDNNALCVDRGIAAKGPAPRTLVISFAESFDIGTCAAAGLPAARRKRLPKAEPAQRAWFRLRTNNTPTDDGDCAPSWRARPPRPRFAATPEVHALDDDRFEYAT